MLCEVFLLSLSLNAIETLQQIQSVEENTNDFGVLKCANAIGKRHFLQPQNVEIISQERVYGFEDFGTIVRTTSEFQYPDHRESLTKYAIIFLESVNDEEDFKILSILSRSDPQGRFIVSIKNEIDPLNLREKYAERIALYLASIERWNVVILMNDTGNKITRIYTYAMYSFGNCSGRVPKLVDHGSCDNAVTLSNLFPAFVNFHKCPIHLSAMEFPPFSIIYEKNGEKQIRGIESNLVKLIVAKLNATYKVIQVANGTAIRDVVKTRKADLAWSCLLQFKEVETTWTQSYMINKVLIVIPQSRLMPFWMNLVLPFQMEVWIALGTLLSVCLPIILLIPSVRRQFHLEWTLSGFFGIGIAKLPTRFSHRIYLISWIFVGYIVMQGYLASLTGFFASPGQYRQMQTLDELDKSGIVAAGLKNMKSQLAQTNPRLSRDFKVCLRYLRVISEAEYFENVAKLTARTGGIASYARIDQILNITHGQESEFIVIPEHINVYPIALLLPNFSIILEGCNRVIHRVCDAGLIDFWRQCLTREMDSGYTKQRDEDSNRKTSLAHLGAVFFVLYVGHCFSSIVFAMELIVGKFRK